MCHVERNTANREVTRRSTSRVGRQDAVHALETTGTEGTVEDRIHGARRSRLSTPVDVVECINLDAPVSLRRALQQCS